MWRLREFRALLTAEVVSVFGDQAARVALALLVFARTSSTLLTALTYGLTFLPAVLGGWLLSGLADRFPRRRVMIATDLVRAALAAVMAIPGLPLAGLWVSVALLTAAAAPFKGAQQALLADVLGPAGYRTGLGLRQASTQTAQLVGFAGGGVLFSVVAANAGLLIDAATFVVSALVVVAGVRARPAPQPGGRPEATATDGPVGGTARRNYRQRVALLAVFPCIIGLYVVPEGLAPPYAHAIGASTLGVGLLMAADPVGSVVGGLLGRWLRRPTSSLALVAMLGVAAGVPLVACVVQPGLVASIVLWAVSGALSTALLVQWSAAVVELIPDHRRGRAMGRFGSVVYTSQGVAILAGGAVAQWSTPFVAVALSGAAAILIAALAGLANRWVRPRRDNAEAGPNSDLMATAGPEQATPAPEQDQRSLLRIRNTPSARSDSPRDPASTEDGGAGVDASPADDARSPSMGVDTSVRPAANQAVPRRHRTAWLRPRQWVLAQQRPSAVAYLVGVEVLAAVVIAVSLLLWPISKHDVLVFGLIVALGVVTAELTRGVERMRRRFSETPHVNFSSVWTLSAALLTTPALAATTAILLYLHLWIRSWRHVTGMTPFRVVFSTSGVVLSCAAASTVVHGKPIEFSALLAGTPISALALIAIIAAYWTVNSGVLAGAIALLQDDRSALRLLGTWHENSLELATLCMGMLVAALMSMQPWLLVVVPLPLYVLHRSVLLRQFEHAAITDSRTGLLNATSWQSQTAAEVDRARRYRSPIGVLMIDLDHFEIVEKTLGSVVADRVVRCAGEAIAHEIRGGDLAGRLAGETFVVTLAGVDATSVLEIANRICRRIRQLRVTTVATDDDGVVAALAALRLSASIGVATDPAGANALEELLTNADNGLFAAQDSGRDRVCAVRPEPPGGRSAAVPAQP